MDMELMINSNNSVLDIVNIINALDNSLDEGTKEGFPPSDVVPVGVLAGDFFEKGSSDQTCFKLIINNRAGDFILRSPALVYNTFLIFR